MYLLKHLAFLCFVFLCINSTMDASLKYQQDITFSSWESKERVEKNAQKFCDATIGDPDIKVIDVKYTEKKDKKSGTLYNAIVTCHVSKVDRDFMRINGKIFQEEHGLKTE